MDRINIVLDDGAFMPQRAHDDDAGMDLMCREEVMIQPGCSAVIDTGVHMEIPRGYYGKIESKSGLNFNRSIVACGGVIDTGYTGSIRVKLYNLGTGWDRFMEGDKVAQIIIQPCVLCCGNLVDEFKDTDRGDNAFGSTGR